MADVLRGRVLWYELLTTDMKAAGQFYSEVVGWTTKSFAGSPQPYDVFERQGGVGVAGVMNVPAGLQVPPHWLMYLGVERLDDAVAEVERRGGEAMSPVIEIPTVGRMRTLRDPQQAAFAVYEPAREARPTELEREPQSGDGSWHELMTTDADAALKFYGEMFGWTPAEPFDMGPMGKYLIFARQWPIGGMMNRPKELTEVPPHWNIYFHVPAINAAAERVKAHGGQVLNGPMEVPGGDWIINAMDPQGAAFSLHAKKQ